MAFVLGTTSKKRLEGVDPDIVKVVERAIELTDTDFVVLEGVRNKKRQAQLLAKGSTKTMNSRHLTGDAVDIAPLVDGKIPWNDIFAFVALSRFVFQAADELGIVLQWGGDWDLDGEWRDESFFDGPHYQIPWPYRVEAAKAAQKKRLMTCSMLKEENRDTDKTELSPDITPGLLPEDMRDEDFDSSDNSADLFGRGEDEEE